MAKATGDTRYWLDREDRIIRVCDQWNLFAATNDGNLALADQVIGRPIWQFLSGDETRMWVDTIFKHVRFIGQPIERPYRCDSEDMRREMRLYILPQPNDILCIESRLIATVHKKRPVHFSTSYGTTLMNKRCSICGRVHHQQQWVEADEITTGDQNPLDCLVIYGVCEDCIALTQFKSVPVPV